MKQQLFDAAPAQSSLVWHARGLHDAGPQAASVVPQHASSFPQSSSPSHAATPPALHSAPASWHTGDAIGPAQHCMPAPHIVSPHTIPAADDEPPPEHTPAVQVSPAGQRCVSSHLKLPSTAGSPYVQPTANARTATTARTSSRYHVIVYC